MTIQQLSPWPSTADSDNFDARADQVGIELPVMIDEINEAITALNFNSTNGTSSTSVTIGTGSKSFTASTGKSWQLGMTIKIANTTTPTNSMLGDVTAYNSGSGALTVNVTQTSGSGTFAAWTISQAGVSSLNIVNSNANKIINGAMIIDQRYEGTTVTPTVNTYLCDRWACDIATSSKLSFIRAIDGPPGYVFSQLITVATQTAPTSGQKYLYRQPIEGINCSEFQLGTSGATNITVGLWIKSSIAGTYSVSLSNSLTDRTYVGTITVTTGWTRQTLTIPGDTTGTWDTGIGDSTGLILSIDLGSGTSFNATSGAWNSGQFTRTSGSVTFVNNTAGATLNITGVSLLAGNIAPDFGTPNIDMELKSCHRYYEKSFTQGNKPAQNIGTGIGEHTAVAITAGATSYRVFERFNASKARIPTMTYYNPSAANAFPRDVTASVNCSAMTGNTPNENAFFAIFTQNASTSINNAMVVHWTAEAELTL